MENDELAKRRELTFLQAEGLAPVPTQLAGHNVTRQTKISLLWLLTKVDGDDFGSETLLPIWTEILGRYHDEIPYSADRRHKDLKGYIEGADGSQILNLIQFVARSSFVTAGGYKLLERICEEELLGYRLVGEYGSPVNVPTLFPVASPEQAGALRKDLDTISDLGQIGARKHLNAAAKALTSGDFSGSVRESIHAVESTAKAVAGGKDADLAGALKKLDRNKPLHPALKQALEKLYAWTSDEKGVRHALIDTDSNVTEAQAIFMLSACAAFSAWLTRENTI